MALSGPISRDELVVLQLLEEIQRLVELGGGETKPSEDVNPRMHPAAKLYLDTRDTFEVIENLVEEHVKGKPKPLRKLSKQLSVSESVGTSTPRSPRETAALDEPNDATIDRIQEMFRHLGSLLGTSILKELRLRKLSIQSILHYVRFLPMEYQWAAYKEARKDEVEQVYRETVFNSLATPGAMMPLSDTQTLHQRAEFVKHQIRNDVDIVCLFAADGTLTTIFGDDGAMVEENVAIKFESLIADVYSSYLRDTLDVQMKHLTQVSDQWGHDIAITSSSKHAAEVGPPLVVQCFYRPRKFRSKGGIFPDMLMNLVNRFVHLPMVHTGQQAKLLVADPRHVGVWWQKSIFSVSERDVTTLHDDESRDIFGKVETLDGQLYVPLLGKGGEQDGSRLFGRSGGLAKWVGQRVLVNNGKDSLWVEVVVVDTDDKRCKLQIKKSLQKCSEVVSWTQFLSLNEWVNMRELRFIVAPVNPHFRVQMGLKFREVIESVQAVVTEISSVFPNGELNDKVGTALWKSVESSISKGEHIFARYFRSILQQDVLTQVHPAIHSSPARSVSNVRSVSVGNVLSGHDNAPQSVVRDMGSQRHISSGINSARGSSIHPTAERGVGYFDESGVYCTRRSSHPGRNGTARSAGLEAATTTRILSPFEKLAHHLLEETEIIGTCIQAQNVALSCAFVQVLLEKIAKMKQNLQTMLQLQSCTVEFVLSEHANSCRLLFVWRICRHQVDTMARQGRKVKRRNRENDGRYIHLNWVDQAFERVEGQILEMMHSLVHYAHRVFFHECMNHLVLGIYEQSWTASKPWFGNTRCTYAVQGFIFRMQLLLEYVNNTVLIGYERNLGVHEKVYELTVRMLLDVLACIAEAYENSVVSRAREGQWKIDILYLVCGVYKLLRQLDQMFSSRGASQSAKGKRQAMNDIRFICLRLLVHLAIRSGPADVVLDTLTKKAQADNFEQYTGVDMISELEHHVVSILDSLDPKGEVLGDFGVDESEKELWRIHTVFGALEIKKLVDVQLNCAALISRSSLPKQALLGFLQQRHELGDWVFPVLTEAELQARHRIQQFIDQINSNTGLNEQEQQNVAPSDQPPEVNSEGNELREGVSGSINLPT